MRTNCIITASGIVTLCKRPYSTPVESGLQSALNRIQITDLLGYIAVQFGTVSPSARGSRLAVIKTKWCLVSG